MCATGKIAFPDRDTAAFEARRLQLRPYCCPRCGGWHLSSKRKLRPKVPKLSARECEAVWTA